MTANTRIISSLGVIALSAAAMWLARGLRPPAPPPPAELNEPLFDVRPSQVQSIDVESWQGGLSAIRAPSGWQVKSVRIRQEIEAGAPEPTPTAEEATRTIDELVRDVVGIPVIDRFPRDGQPLADYGLEGPQATIVLGIDDGSTRRLEIGGHTLTSSALYARFVPGDDVVQVGAALFGTIDAALYRLRSLTAPA